MTTKIAIINRSFWPASRVIGKVLLELSKELSKDNNVSVITQSSHDLTQFVEEENLETLKFSACKNLSDSSSSILMRIIDAIYFSLYLVIKLLSYKPDRVYISTNPPVIAPFIASMYCKLFRKDLIYHVQDIHPEISESVTKIPRIFTRLLKMIDNFTINSAWKVITLTSGMLDYLERRSNSTIKKVLLPNPGTSDFTEPQMKNDSFIYCGNLGRLQKVDVLIESLENYYDRGGRLTTTFIGGGVFLPKINELSLRYPEKIQALGPLDPESSQVESSKHKWAFISLDDSANQLAFPSKSSSYLIAKNNLIGICGENSDLANWIKDNKVGYVAGLTCEEITDLFFEIEHGSISYHEIPDSFSDMLTIESHVQELKKIIEEKSHDEKNI
ncbi:hypothetical protein BCT82_03670 [Vibrio breoganii]|uniref:hypothetical protein n=1 Tax=Vibrio breoganii TaxID=553239 RepID=UPI000C826D1F|nr:hypothetical protein [Vibrio breoganii]PML20713.1 hypothetical protein BCT82_03670 [Vibrio breoganii]